MTKSLPIGQKAVSAKNRNVLALTVPADAATQSQRRRILDAFASSCAEKTFATLTIADIVGRAGVSRATFYKHFDNKRECFDAATDFFVEEMYTAAGRVQSNTATGPENVRAAIAAILELMTAMPDYTRLVVVEAIAVDPSLIDRFRSILIAAMRIARGDADDSQPSNSVIRTAYGQAQVLIANQILAGGTGGNGTPSDLLPDLVYISLLPFAGPGEAMKQARLAR